MKSLAAIFLITICLSMLGCGTVAHIMQDKYMTPSGSDWINDAGADNYTGSFQVYHSNPYALHLGIEETDSEGEIETLNGDGGASLNAYAACLTLKVIF